MKKILLFLALGASLITCKNEPVETIDSQKIIGKWQISSATRNGDATKTLDNLYFSFFEDGKMETNLPTISGSSNYTLDGSTIEQRKDKQEVNYTIESVGDSTLVLNTKIRDFDFRLVLAKAMD